MWIVECTPDVSLLQSKCVQLFCLHFQSFCVVQTNFQPSFDKTNRHGIFSLFNLCISTFSFTALCRENLPVDFPWLGLFSLHPFISHYSDLVPTTEFAVPSIFTWNLNCRGKRILNRHTSALFLYSDLRGISPWLEHLLTGILFRFLKCSLFPPISGHADYKFCRITERPPKLSPPPSAAFLDSTPIFSLDVTDIHTHAHNNQASMSRCTAYYSHNPGIVNR